MNVENNLSLEHIMFKAMASPVDDVAPNFRKRTVMSSGQIEKIIQAIGFNLDLAPERVYIGIVLLFLQGAASAGSPLTMSVDLGNGKYILKKNLIDACNLVVKHTFIRRIAETLALEIGNFAFKNKLVGELGYRINNRLKAETGESLNEKEMAFCSSFSEIIPNLSEVASERLLKLLAEDYQRKFEHNKKYKNTSYLDWDKNKTVKKIKKKR